MSHQSRRDDFQTLFDTFTASLQKYEKQTGIALSKYPLAEKIRNSDSTETVIAILQEQVTLPACNETDRITKSLTGIISAMYTLSVCFDLNWVRSKMLIDCIVPSLMPILKPSPIAEPIYAGFAILLAVRLVPSFLRTYFSDIQMLQTVKDVSALDPLVDLLETIESILKHLDICTKVPHTAGMTETLVKTLVELLSILGLATNLLKQKQPGKCLLTGILSDSMQRRDVC